MGFKFDRAALGQVLPPQPLSFNDDAIPAPGPIGMIPMGNMNRLSRSGKTRRQSHDDNRTQPKQTQLTTTHIEHSSSKKTSWSYNTFAI